MYQTNTLKLKSTSHTKRLDCQICSTPPLPQDINKRLECDVMKYTVVFT